LRRVCVRVCVCECVCVCVCVCVSVGGCQSVGYRVAKMHRMPCLYTSFSAKETCD